MIADGAKCPKFRKIREEAWTQRQRKLATPVDKQSKSGLVHATNSVNNMSTQEDMT